MGVPVQYRRSSEGIASYNFTDIIQGKGFIDLFGAFMNSAKTPVLTQAAYYSDKVTENSGSVSVTMTPSKVLDVDFDITFGRPLVIEGILIANVPIGCNDSGTGEGKTTYAIVKARHWDGTTETDLSSAQSSTLSTGSGTTTTAIKALSVDISATTFGVNDTLRLTVELWGTTDTTTKNATFYIAADPLGREDSDSVFSTSNGDGITTMKFKVPVRVDV